MRVTKVVLGLAGLLLMSLVFVSFQAAAHPDASDGGIAKAREKAGTDLPFAGLDNHFDYDEFGITESEIGTKVMDEQIAHNPLCSGHDD